MASIAGLLDVPVWVGLAAAAAALVYVHVRRCHGVWARLGVPGPPPSMLTGHLDKIFGPDGSRAAFARWKAQFGPVHGIYFLRSPVLVVHDVQLLKHVFVKDFATFTDLMFIGEGKLQQHFMRKNLFFANGEDWRRLRRIASPTFSSGKLKAHVLPHINLPARALADKMAALAADGENGSAEALFSALALDVIGRAAFGLDIDSQSDPNHPFIRHAKAIMTFGRKTELVILASGIFPPLVRVFEALGIGIFDSAEVSYFKRLVLKLVAERKADGESSSKEDFLQLLINAEAEEENDVDLGDSRRLTQDEITAQCVLFFIAGYSTTSACLQFLFYELGRHQEVQDKVVEEIKQNVVDPSNITYQELGQLKYLEAVVMEALRMYPPLPVVNRKASADIKLGEFQVPKDACVYVPMANIMMDPELFPEPEQFRPERHLEASTTSVDHKGPTFLSFGFGPRQCVGQRLAMMEVKAAVAAALARVAVVASAPTPLPLKDLHVLEPKEPIVLTLAPRDC